MRHFRWLSFLFLLGLQGIFSLVAGSAEPARATAGAGKEKDARVAVVIGNSRYPSAALENPKNDATAMAAALRKLGFDVELKLDATKADMDAVFRRFSHKAEKAAVAALFYAGHGIQVNGSNYIVPIDAKPQSERDLKREMVKMDDVIDDMGAAKVKLVFFDACRDNPLSRSFSRGGARGMAAPVEATGTLISFATKHGNTAADGDGRHSPYTTALLAALENPGGVEIEQMLRKVQQGVKQATNGQQEPWRYGSLDGDFYFKAVDDAVEAGKRQAAADAAMLEAMRRENERATKDRSELQQALKAQQEASDRAVTDAIKRSNEQAARERAELQQSMEKMLKEALARQNAAVEAERQARQVPAEAAKAQAPPPAPAAAVASQSTAKAAGQAVPEVAKTVTPAPVQIAMIAPGKPAAASSSPASSSAYPRAGDSWTYRYVDGWKSDQAQTIVVRVEESEGGRVTDKMSLRGARSADERSYEGRPEAVQRTLGSGVRVIELLPYVQGLLQDGLKPGQEKSFPDIVIDGRTFGIRTKLVGQEKITVPAGTFDAVRVNVVGQGSGGPSIQQGPTAVYTFSHAVWFVPEIRRIVKAEHRAANASGRRVDDDTLELVSFDSGKGQAPGREASPIQLATIAPASPGAASGPSAETLAALANAPGDEWEYLVIDEMFGKKQKLVLRVKAASAEGVLEDLFWNGRHVLDWVFGSRAAAIGTPNESEFMFAPHWDGKEISDFLVEGGRGFCTGAGQFCRIKAKISGTEKLTIAAGTFDAVRLDGWVTLGSAQHTRDCRVTIWYSQDSRRLLKQSAEQTTNWGLGGFPRFKETLELSAIRPARR